MVSLFPKLTDGYSHRSEQTAVSHSVGRLTKKATFAEGEEVIVYDLKSKLSFTGKITEVLGNNTYLADCGSGPQHISGDVISRVSDVSRRQIGARQTAEDDAGGQDRQSAETDVIMDQDVISVSSDGSDDEDDVLEDAIPRVQVPRHARRYRRNAEMLGPIREQRLRTRR